ncbi:hypothetical protein [Romboutsia lituseburensis]|uniref:hypothetical protein n=1 Tax=Romboutsia lituseburensis TaxID=1537 RepID=UPI00215AE36C|nr:hypothetical protein [Romboutsia lituseburensis]MCR8746829.1 hypothetical protein [Romboutsia lituseburensis]
MLSKKMKQFTIVDIIERQMQFIKSNTVFDKIDFKHNDEGELLAYNEMLQDIKIMNEDDFKNKYIKIIDDIEAHCEKINEQVNSIEILNKNKNEVDKICGYNNAIVLILRCINPSVYYTEYRNWMPTNTINKKMKDITMIDIIERQIQFVKDNIIFDKLYNTGEQLGYKEILKDIKIMNEDDFVNKYFNIVKNLRIKFNNEDILNQDYAEKMCGYDESIELILKYIDPMYGHDLPMCLYEITSNT